MGAPANTRDRLQAELAEKGITLVFDGADLPAHVAEKLVSSPYSGCSYAYREDQHRWFGMALSPQVIGQCDTRWLIRELERTIEHAERRGVE